MKIKYISWLPAVIIMAIIFYFSSKPATSSGESSLMISQTLLNVYENITDLSYEEANRLQVLYELDHIVRKSAHFIEYAMLAAAWFLHFICLKTGIKSRIGLSILITSAYAATDEFHQTLVVGRSGQISDVLLDSAGGVAGVIAFQLMIILIGKSRSKSARAKIQQKNGSFL